MQRVKNRILGIALRSLAFLFCCMSKSGVAYCIGSVLLWAGFSYYGARFAVRKSSPSARQLLAASIIYLPSLFVLMILLNHGSGGCTEAKI